MLVLVTFHQDTINKFGVLDVLFYLALAHITKIQYGITYSYNLLYTC